MSNHFKNSPEDPQSTRAPLGPKPGRAAANSPLLTLREWCRQLGFSQNTGRKFVDEGMPCIRADRLIRIEPDRALEWLRTRGDHVRARPSAEPARPTDA